MFNYHLYTQGLLLVVWGDSRKTAMICSLKPFSFPPGGLLPSNPMLVVRICKVRARDILIQGDSSWQSSGEGGTRSLQGASSQVPKGYLGYFRGHLGIRLWPVGRVPCTGQSFLRGVGIFTSTPPSSILERERCRFCPPAWLNENCSASGRRLFDQIWKITINFRPLSPQRFFFFKHFITPVQLLLAREFSD